MKKIIISGATGQLAFYMIEFLLGQEETYEILLATRRTSELINSNIKEFLAKPNVRIVHFDLCDVHSITSLIRNEKPDYFINFAAQTTVSNSWESPLLHLQSNEIAILHILEAVRNYAPKCRLFSSGSTEQFSLNSPYAISKAACGMLCKIYREKYNLYLVHGILSNNESPKRGETFLSRKISLGVARIYHSIQNSLVKKVSLKFEPIELGNLYSQKDWSFSGDFVEAIWKMLNQKAPKDYLLASGQFRKVKELVEKAFLSAGINGSWVKKLNNNPLTERYELTFPSKGLNNGGFTGLPLVIINPKFYRQTEENSENYDIGPAINELNWSPKVSFSGLISMMVRQDIENYQR